jgi:hypothetical protein
VSPWTSTQVSPEDSDLCADCYNLILENQNYDYDRIKAAIAKGESVDIPSYDEEFSKIIEEMKYCVYKCKNCVYNDFSQDANFNWKTSCTITNTMTNEFRQTATLNVIQNLENQTGVMAALAGVMGGGDVQKTVANIHNRVTQLVDVNLLQTMSNEMLAKQNITVTGASTSVGATEGISQTSAITGVIDMFESTNIANNLLSEQEWSVLQTVINENTTIGRFGEFAMENMVTFAEFIDTTAGQVLRISIIIGAIIISGMAMYAWFRVYRKDTTKGKLTLTTQ